MSLDNSKTANTYRKFRQLDQAMNWIVSADDLTEMKKRFSFVVQSNSVFLRFIEWGVGAKPGLTGIPEGMPPVKLEDVPVDMGDTTLTAEFRKIATFLEGGPVHKLTPLRKESNWIQILQGVQSLEAKFLTDVKDKKLLEVYPDLVDILPDFIPGFVQPELTTKKKSKPKKVINKVSDQTIQA
jgi:hypothetical protein